MLDKNKNGEIDKTEQEEAMKNIHSMTLPKARWAWSAMDTDGDGKISEKEFQEGMQAIADKVGEEQLLDSIIRAWPDHPLALEKAKKEKEAVLAAVKQDDRGFATAGKQELPAEAVGTYSYDGWPVECLVLREDGSFKLTDAKDMELGQGYHMEIADIYEGKWLVRSTDSATLKLTLVTEKSSYYHRDLKEVAVREEFEASFQRPGGPVNLRGNTYTR